MASKPTNDQARREAEEAAHRAELLREHAPDGPPPTEGGVYERKGDLLERVVEAEDRLVPASQQEE